MAGRTLHRAAVVVPVARRLPRRQRHADWRRAANLAVAGIAERNGIRFGFIQYLAYGVPMTLVSIAICQAYVWLRYF